MVETVPYKLPSMIGGISQQSPQDRPPACAEDEENIDAIALKGAKARNGSEYLGRINKFYEDPFYHSIVRSVDENYMVIIEDGAVDVVNVATGAVAVVTGIDSGTPPIADYFAHTGAAREAFAAVTVEDKTFIANREQITRMRTALTDARPNRAVFYFKAAAYSTEYVMSITWDGTTYSATYTTPNNSDPDNALYIDTGTLAVEFVDAFELVPALVAAGFTFTANGSMVVVDGPSTGVTEFTIDSKDGQGDTHLISFKDWVRKYADLPARAPQGYVVGVRGAVQDQKDDYWVQYTGKGMTGRWVEIAKPEITFRIDNDKMPMILTNTGPDTFTLTKGTWGERLVGDGDKSSPDPEFIGRRIISLNFIAGRLVLCTEGTASMSRSRNSYVFFPDTAQARLATDPIGLDIQNGQVTIIRETVAVSEKLFLWGHKAQLRLDSGDGPHSEENTEALPSTNYEYDGRVPPLAIGMSSVVFGTQNDAGTRMVEVMYRNGSAIGEIPLTDHVPELIEGDLRHIIGGAASGSLGVITTALDDGFYFYRWLNQGDQRVQTAWNKWRFKGIDKVLGGTINGAYLYLLVSIGTYTHIERIRLNPGRGPMQAIRLDHRLTQEDGDWLLVDEEQGIYEFVIPYSVEEPDREHYVAVDAAVTDGVYYQGRQLPMTWVDSNTVRITYGLEGLIGEEHAPQWFFGAKVTTYRKLSQLFIQTEAGPLYADNLQIAGIRVSHSDTHRYRVEVRQKDGTVISTEEFNGKFPTLPQVVNNKQPSLSGSLTASVGSLAEEVDIFLINDSVYPSCWTGMDYHYSADRVPKRR